MNPRATDPNLVSAPTHATDLCADRRLRRRSDSGQSTAEYALLILGVASIALLVLAWAGTTGAIGDLFDKVISWVSSQVT